MNADEVERSAKNIWINRTAINHARILADAEAALERSREPGSAESQPSIWRRIMKSPITKLSSAAVVIIAVTVGILHFGGPISGNGVVWAEAIKNMEQASSAIMREKRVFTCNGQEIPFLNSDAVRYYSCEYGAREDMYNTQGFTLYQVCWLTQENVRVKVVPPMQQYERTELTEAERALWGQPGFRAIVDLLKAEDPTPLGRTIVNGKETEGFELKEITTSKMVGVLPIQVDSGVARFWIDVKTSLPVRYEAELLISDKLVTSMTDGKPIRLAVTGHELRWNVEIEPSIFEPDVPRDFTLLKSDSGGAVLPQGVEDIGTWVRQNLGQYEFIAKSRRGVTVVLRKEFLADIAVFKLQGEPKDVRDFYKKLDIYFIGAGTASGGRYKILSPQLAKHVFELSESSDVCTLVTRPKLMVGNGHKYVISINDLGSAVLRPIQKYGERHVDVSFSFFPHGQESVEAPGARRASVDIPSGIKTGPDEAVLIRCEEPETLVLVKVEQD
jgi:hypothetical protein